MSLEMPKLMKFITWNSPENTKPQTSKWHRNHSAIASWFYRWWIVLTIPGPLPEKHYYIELMMKTISVEKLVFREPVNDT